MPLECTYTHTNIVAKDWRKLAAFYQQVFNCQPVPPERDLQGEWLQRATGVEDAHLRGAHLRLPGCGENGPTLEIFQYNTLAAESPRAINQPGLAHLAFAVNDVRAARAEVLAHGGSDLGEVVTVQVPGKGEICFVYMRDPEGNILELQRWG
ncbi:glyoxalase [Ornatilinea apprima]|uniref:Glyoxalase n=1 Tax=Ornatilinea apprima TaxID=1134406 RepID=A0A0P6XW32_9CHLR|nr:VOC family protein [Ornatilinea apprima]KPL77643.1 glyoxalase [Ornatilinea apprima]